MAKLTTEMIDEAIREGVGCYPYNGDLVVLYKNLPVKDKDVSKYVEGINDLKSQGIPTPRIHEYKKVAKGYPNDYSMYVILEDKAKGKNIDFDSISVSLDSSSKELDQAALEYLQNLDEYIEELVKRSLAKELVFADFIKNYLNISKAGFQIDPKPSNFFFDENEGFSFIDINGPGPNDLEENLPRYILNIVLGNRLPKIFINNHDYNIFDKERFDKLTEAFCKIIEKVSSSLVSYGYSKEKVLDAVSICAPRLKEFILIDDIHDLSIELAKIFAEEKEKASLPKEKEEVDLSVGW